MKAIEEINFQAYLESVLNDKAYGDCWHFYTPTDGAIRPKLDLRVKKYRLPRTEVGQEPNNKEVLSVLDGLRKYQSEHVLLVGKPGSGKSTALEKLLLEEAEKAKSNSQVKVPVLVRLRQYQTSVLDLVRDFLMGHGVFLDVDQLQQLLIKGQFLILLDGVNELPYDSARTDLNNFRRRYRKNTPMILTTRDLSLWGIDGVEHKLVMKPLKEEQIREFIQECFLEQHQQILQQMGVHLRKFAETPLLLAMLCNIFEKNKKIPESLGEAFQNFSQIYDSKLREANVPTYESSQMVWSEILQHLAFVMMQGNSPTELSLKITKQKARELIKQKFNIPYHQASLWLEDLLKYHLIQEFDTDQIEFRHQLIQEYYAARRFISNDNCLIELMEYITDSRWREVFLFAIGMIESADQLLALMRSKIDQVLSEDEKLQNFLDWIYKKSESVKTKYKPVATRAFYYDLSGNFLIGKLGWKVATNQFNDLLFSLLPTQKFEISQSIDKSLCFAFEREYEIDYINDRCQDLWIWEEEQRRWLEYEAYKYDFRPEHENIKNEEIETEIEDLVKEYNNSENQLDLELHYDLLIADTFQKSLVTSYFEFSAILPPTPYQYPSTPRIDLASDLKKSMKILFDSMEDLMVQASTFSDRNSEEYRSWWQSNGYQWLKEFISIIREHRNIGNNWEFSDAQKQLLRSHYYANQLLIDCLKSVNHISAKARQEIEDLLLLPIIEIEKLCTGQSSFTSTIIDNSLSNQIVNYYLQGSTIGNLAHNVQGNQHS
ncbi:MAG: NACHT domain-containing protein [Thermosynechococcaceae cyanobacterium]